MPSLKHGLAEAAETVRSRVTFTPSVGVVLGSGLGAFVNQLEELVRVPFSDIPHMPLPSVAGHAGFLAGGRLGSAGIVCLSGRVHLYEGRAVEEVVFGSELLAALGCSSVILTNAAGGIRDDLRSGSLMLIEDHLNLTGTSPLRGPGYTFLDMTHAYDPGLRKAALDAAVRVGVPLARGVYAGLLGPSYETPAEIRMLRTLGADAVGMSTVLEAIALRHAGARVGAMSCVTNPAAGVSEATLDHAEVQAVAAASAKSFQAVLAEWVQIAATLG